ncbi:hypothetical protein F66182_15307 [Fusarium sp. NRRL 66182]|nr:hypothetical protein F66182_15307 [Fusarium sp. NRRL 66182]
MAAPADTTIQNLNGTWVLNKSLSTDIEPLLALQGIGWLTRKAIGVATITLAVTQHIEPNADDPSNAPITKINIEQTATGGIKSTESRTTDWRVREHKDRTFGQCAAQSRLVRGQKGADGKIRPVFEVQSEPKEEKIQRFLRGEITVDGEEDPEGFLVEDAQEKDGVTYPEGEGLWLQSFVRSEEAPWTAEQIWGFETINGQRYHSRRLVVATKDGKYLFGRLVYDFQG